MGELVSRSELTKSFMNGVGGIGAGLGLLIINAIASSPVMWVAAGVCGVIGLGMLISKSQKKAGAAMLVAGALAGIAGIASLGVGWLVVIAGVGLIGLGGYSLFKFVSNLKKRM